MNENEMALKILKENPLENAAALGMLARGTIAECKVSGRSVLLYDGKAQIYVLHPSEEGEVIRLCGLLPDVCDLFLTDTSKKAVLEKERSVSFYMPCIQYVYAGIRPAPSACEAEIRTLNAGDTDFVVRHYSNPGVSNASYIRSRIEDGPAFGAYIAGNMAGFILTHSEGSMGALEVLPEYRRLGIAYALECRMIDALLERGAVPFGHIKLGNTASEKLQQKLGLVKTEKEVAWTTVHKRDSV